MAPKRRKLEDFSFAALSSVTDLDGSPDAPKATQTANGRPSTSPSTTTASKRTSKAASSTPSSKREGGAGRNGVGESSAVAAVSNGDHNDASSSNDAGLEPGPASGPTSSPPRSRTRRSTRPPAARRGRDGAAQAARDGATNIPIARILYLPEDLIEPIRVYRATHGITNTQLALRALNATYRQIPDLLAAEHQPQVVTGELFDEVVPGPAKSNRQVEITPTAAQLATIDPLVASTGANDRSHLFALAIRQFLTDAGLFQP